MWSQRGSSVGTAMTLSSCSPSSSIFSSATGRASITHPGNVHYPSDYGFIPRSYYDDEDPFDVLVLVEERTFPGCVIETRPVALLKMDDDGEQDDKVIAVPTEDPRWDHIRDFDDVPRQTLAEIDEFFETYKNLEEGKEVETLGWEDREAAYDAIEHARDLYEQHFG